MFKHIFLLIELITEYRFLSDTSFYPKIILTVYDYLNSYDLNALYEKAEHC